MAQSNTAQSLAGASISWVERGLVPDPLIRAGIRQIGRASCRERV